tara:strand:+ start:39788 stop:40339 length:552 start_codon:yes stop_codon:yes gene_type:complete
MFEVPFIKKNIQFDRNRIVNSIRDHAPTLKIPNPWEKQSDVITSIAEDENVWQDEEIFNGIQPLVKEYLQMTIGQPVKTSLHMWYNIYNKGFHQEQHNHNSIRQLASGIVYVQMPKGSTATTFINPMKTMFNACEYKQELTMTTPKVVEGDCIIFPPWLEHRVDKQYDTEGTRVTVAFNISNL